MKRALRLAATIISDLQHAARLTAGPRAFWRLASDLLLVRLIGVAKNPAFTRRFNQQRRAKLRGGTTLFYRFNKGDLHAVREIWFHHNYRLPSEYSENCFSGQTLVDLGANIGMTSLWLARRYGFSRVIAVEPVRGNLQVVEKNLRGNNIEFQGFEAAVAARDGSVLFSDSSSSTNGLVLKEIDGASTGREVRAASMQTILADLPQNTLLPLVKIDVEGGETDLLGGTESTLAWLDLVQNLIIEFHPTRVDYPALKNVLEQRGLQRARVEQSHPRGDEIEILEFYTRG